MFYGTVVWDPWLIVAQIVGIQCLYYLTLGAFLTIFVGTRVSRMSLVYFFDYATVTASTGTGWCVIASIMLSAVAGAGYLLYLIERAKKCLDFSAPVYIIHLFICIAYGGWPSSITWWVVNGTGLSVMALLGEYLCVKRELREIPITRSRSSISMDTKLRTRFMSSSKGKSSSSSEELVLNDEDLLTLILLHVPWKKLMSLKCVSRQWRSLIIAPHFRTLLPPLRASGLFFQLRDEFRYDHISNLDEVCFVHLDNPNIPSPFRNLTFAHYPFDPENIRILQSCNGLLLCSSASSAPHNQYNHYVYNPSTNQLATLPKHPLNTGYRFHHVGLTFDPSKSIHYKIIAFVTTYLSPSHYTGDFHIYSSETGTWKASVQSFSSAPRMFFRGGVYWNGCMHWLSPLYFEFQPGLSNFDCLYFNVDGERLETFPRPPINVRGTSRKSLYFGESEDHLHVSVICHYAISCSVFEMKSDYSEWFVKYVIDLDPISKVFPEIKSKLRNGYTHTVDVLSIIRRENFREDSFMVLNIPGKAIRYNLVNRSFKLIGDFGPRVTGYLSPGSLYVWQYIESVSCV